MPLVPAATTPPAESAATANPHLASMAQSMSDSLAALWDPVRTWLDERVLRLSTLMELGVVLGCLLAAWVLWRALRPRLNARFGHLTQGSDYFATFMRTLRRVFWAGPAVVLLGAAALVYQGLGLEHLILSAALKLVAAWVVIRLLVTLIPNRFWARTLALFLWTGVALSVLGLLGPASRALDSLALTFGGSRISLLSVVKAGLMAVVLVQAAALLSRFFDARIHRSAQFSPSVQVLLTKTVTILLYGAAILLAVSGLGIDLTSLALLSGAIGVGIGFGLQKIFSNLISGVILLLDRSIKPGDTIEVSGVFGRVEAMSARYSSVLTRDGKEYLIPNENLITSEVINWSHNDSNVRVKVPVGVSYDSDLRLVEKLLNQAVDGVDRVLAKPQPFVRLMGFGDSSVDFEIRYWLADPMDGIVNVTSNILFKVWDLFQEHGVEIPFPQRDLHLKTLPEGYGDKPKE